MAGALADENTTCLPFELK